MLATWCGSAGCTSEPSSAVKRALAPDWFDALSGCGQNGRSPDESGNPGGGTDCECPFCCSNVGCKQAAGAADGSLGAALPSCGRGLRAESMARASSASAGTPEGVSNRAPFAVAGAAVDICSLARRGMPGSCSCESSDRPSGLAPIVSEASGGIACTIGRAAEIWDDITSVLPCKTVEQSGWTETSRAVRERVAGASKGPVLVVSVLILNGTRATRNILTKVACRHFATQSNPDKLQSTIVWRRTPVQGRKWPSTQNLPKGHSMPRAALGSNAQHNKTVLGGTPVAWDALRHNAY